MKKIFFLLVCFFICSHASAQQYASLLKILNQELTSRIKNQFKEWDASEDTLSIAQPFHITDEGLLSYSIKTQEAYLNSYIIQRYRVDPTKVTTLSRDGHFIFEVSDGSALTVSTHYTEAGESSKEYVGDLFLLGFSGNKKSSSVANAIIKAFQEAGITVQKGDGVK
jgi:hypothetical protein